MVSQILMEQGFGTQLQAPVYRFKGENTVYWIYSFKLGSYYPLCGAATSRGIRHRDQLKSVMGRKLPIKKDEAKGYLMW
jgi:hypothetical protein